MSITRLELLSPAVIGFKGRKRTGKSTAAAAFREVAGCGTEADIEFSDPIIDVANLALSRTYRLDYWPLGLNLVEAAGEILGLESSRLEPGWRSRSDEARDVDNRLAKWVRLIGPDFRMDRNNKDSHRAILIWLGVNIRYLFGPEVWASEIGRRIDAAKSQPLVTVGGVRYPNDTTPISGHDGLMVEVLRDGITHDDDPTNAKHNEIAVDTVIHNNVSLAGLRSIASEILSHWRAGYVKSAYGPAA